LNTEADAIGFAATTNGSQNASHKPSTEEESKTNDD
jgi:hypothetical protein